MTALFSAGYLDFVLMLAAHWPRRNG